MDQTEKDLLIRNAGEVAIEEVARMLQVTPTLENVKATMELAMGSDLLKIYKISLYYGVEADRCFERGAFFASCLLTAATNEAFLALICFLEQAAVRSTTAFRGLHKPSKTFRDVVADFNLDKLIKISNELGWIPVDIINEELLEAVVTDFPKLAKTVYPSWEQTKIDGKIALFRSSPGAEMLKIMQDMRNLVHAPRWLKTGSVLDDVEFEQNCKLAVLVGREVAQCLCIRVANLYETALQGLSPAYCFPTSVDTA